MTNDNCLADARDVFNAVKIRALFITTVVVLSLLAYGAISYVNVPEAAEFGVGTAIKFSTISALVALSAPFLAMFLIVDSVKLQSKDKARQKALAILMASKWDWVVYGATLLVVEAIQSGIIDFMLWLPDVIAATSLFWLVSSIFGGADKALDV